MRRQPEVVIFYFAEVTVFPDQAAGTYSINVCLFETYSVTQLKIGAGDRTPYTCPGIFLTDALAM